MDASIFSYDVNVMSSWCACNYVIGNVFMRWLWCCYYEDFESCGEVLVIKFLWFWTAKIDGQNLMWRWFVAPKKLQPSFCIVSLLNPLDIPAAFNLSRSVCALALFRKLPVKLCFKCFFASRSFTPHVFSCVSLGVVWCCRVWLFVFSCCIYLRIK